MRTFTLLLLTTLVSTPLFAQQLPLFTQYRSYHSFINPASVNSDFFLYEHNFSAHIARRQQWNKIDEGSPVTNTIKMEYIYNKNTVLPLLFGLQGINDRIGPIQFSGGYFRLGGLLLTNDPSNGAVVVGLSVGAIWQKIDWSMVRFFEEITVAEVSNKPFIDAGVGIYAYKYIYSGLLEGDNIYAGISSPQTFESDIKYGSTLTLKRIRHYYFQLGLYKYLNEDSFIEPSIWLKYVPGFGLHADMNVRYQFSNFLWIGTGFSTSKMLNLEFGGLLGEWLWSDSNMKFSYSFSQSYENGNGGSIHSSFGLTHEISIAFTIDTLGKY